ncbi:hypothetical protein LTS18_005594, partial [Coniosporium uncinatum]
MLLRALLLPTAALLLPTVSAIFVDDAFKVDFHHALLGFPQQQTTFFHSPYAGNKASLIYTLSEKNVLGAVNPKDGSIVWRQHLSSGNATEALLRAGDAQDTVVSAAGNEVSAWSASDGRLVWSNRLGSGGIRDLEILELPQVTEGPKDAIALWAGQSPVVRRLDGKTGEVQWQFEDDSGDTPLQVSASATDVFYVSLHGGMMGGASVRVATLDPTTGKKINVQSVNTASEVSSADDILFVGQNSATPILAWNDEKHT